MATTKIWPVKNSLKRLVDYASNPDKTTKDDLESVIMYAMNGEKTTGKDESSCYVTGINCSAETVFEEMFNVQQLFGKTDGNVAYHCYQSFKPGEVTPEQCHQLGIELARRMWGDKYQVLIATHLDRNHLHNHLICCSVSFIDGRKFNDNKGAYARLRNLSDDICRENGLSIIEKPKGKTPRQLHFAEQKGEPTRYNLMRETIDNAISLSPNMPTFIKVMKQFGYEIDYSRNRKYPTIRSVNSKKATRLYRLGPEYELGRISEHIDEQTLDTVMNNRDEFISSMPSPPVRKRVHVNGTRKYRMKITGIYAEYLHLLYLMGYRPKNKHKPLSPELREASRMCDKYSACAKLIAREHLRTDQDCREFIARTQQRIDTLSGERNKIRNRLRREKDPDSIDELKTERNRLTDEITTLRKDIKIAEFTLERSEDIGKLIEIEEATCGRISVRRTQNQQLSRNDREERDAR